MKKITVLFIISTLSTFILSGQADFEKQTQTQLIMVEDGGIVELPAGNFQLSSSLSMDGKKEVTIRGAGMDKTILSFKNQTNGAEGLKVINSKNIVLEGFTIQNSKGDAIKVQETDGITFLKVKAEWTGRQSKKNGAYGLYPVQCQNVLIDYCEAVGASDAGIYVGQSHQIIVRNSRAFKNVAGIEIENSTMADVYNNVTVDNTGGILVFDLPGLIKKKGGNVRVYNNEVKNNNHKNFAEKGTAVAGVPPGTGIMIMATSEVEVYENKIIDNKTAGTSIVSYYLSGNSFDDEEYDPYPYQIYVHDNEFQKGKKGKMAPTWSHKIGFLFQLKFGRQVPNILFDGIVDKKHLDESGNRKENFKICIRNNTNGTFANLDADNDFKNISHDLTPFDCTQKSLVPAELQVIKK